MSVYNFRGNLNLIHQPSGNAVVLATSEPNDLIVSNGTNTFATFHVAPANTPLTLPTLPAATSIAANNVVIVDAGGNLGVSNIANLANITLIGNNGILVTNAFPNYTVQIDPIGVPQMGGQTSIRTSTAPFVITDTAGTYAYNQFAYVAGSANIFTLVPLAGRTYHVDLKLAGTNIYAHVAVKLLNGTVSNIINDQSPAGLVNWVGGANLTFTGTSSNWSIGAEILASG